MALDGWWGRAYPEDRLGWLREGVAWTVAEPSKEGARMKAIRRWLGLGVAAGLFVPGVWGAAPPNDDFAAATIVAGFPATATGSNVDATMEEGEPVLGEWFD